MISTARRLKDFDTYHNLAWANTAGFGTYSKAIEPMSAFEKQFLRNYKHYPVRRFIAAVLNGHSFDNSKRYLFFNATQLREFTKSGASRIKGISLDPIIQDNSIGRPVDCWAYPSIQNGLLDFNFHEVSTSLGRNAFCRVMLSAYGNIIDTGRMHSTYRMDDSDPSPLMRSRSKLLRKTVEKYKTIDDIPKSWRKTIGDSANIAGQFELFHSCIEQIGEVSIEGYVSQFKISGFKDRHGCHLQPAYYNDVDDLYFIEEAQQDYRTPAEFMYDILSMNNKLFV